MWTAIETSMSIGIPVGVLAGAFGGLLGSILYRWTAGRSIEVARLGRQKMQEDAAFYLGQEAQTRDPEARKRIREMRLMLLADYASKSLLTARALAPPKISPEPAPPRIEGEGGPGHDKDAW